MNMFASVEKARQRKDDRGHPALGNKGTDRLGGKFLSANIQSNLCKAGLGVTLPSRKQAAKIATEM